MFNDEDVKKKAFRDDILYVSFLVIILLVLIFGACYAFYPSISTKTETAQPEPIPTVEYEMKNEKDGESNDFAVTEPVFEMNDECQHKWIISDKYLTLIRSVKLECIASEGIDVVYLTRYRGSFENSYDDIYIAYDEHLKDITLQYFDGVFEIEYFSAGVGMGTPRMEEYEFTLYACENEDCNSLQHVAGEKLTLYRFYIPEGTYLISH